ncbi:acyltransferase [Actinacidiphila sp. DG2A-62]|jgi:peptidoglycan/LPS O-acetylase OafA/YrhL|uniref:acyltransferase family protein n=1 Tax=Actinacidiphila sp. DG2A-62 TaxID=3108821 RepID=UPI002DBB0A4E|nr:acyltransferase [Actinacidiphila sp. DG2A-62]MEC3994213.1 acyltransferase [Actinacidiphila sp. DG2A-62]
MAIRGIRSGVTTLPKRLDSLTSLRFFAAFAVFTHHFTGFGGKTGLGRSPLIYPYSMIGGHGVTFFFVLSGFLMMWVFKPKEHPGVFYWRRVGRIWPAHLVALVLGIYAYYIAAHLKINWPSLIASAFLVQTWSPNVTPTLPGNEVTWTLSVELLFYALFPLLGRIAVRLRTRWLAAATAVGLAGMWAVDWFATAHYSPAHAGWVMRHPAVYLPQFMLGMTMALAIKRGWRLPLRPVVPIALLAAYVYCYYQGRARLSAPTVAQLDYTVRPIVAILSALVILAFVQREVRGLRGLLNTKPLVLLGLWSYCFYLLHHSITRIAIYQWGRMPDNNGVLFTLLGFGVVVNVMAWALFTFVEEPAEKWWRKRTPKRWLNRGEKPAVTIPAPRRPETESIPG